MNPFNVLWIGLTWMLAVCAFGGYFAGDSRLALVVVVTMAVLITGETISIDRVERETDWEKGEDDGEHHNLAP